MTRRKTQLDPAIQRVRIDKLRIFEISESELEALERGSAESIFLNLSIAAFSIAVSFTITITTTTIEDIRTFCSFFIVMAVGYVVTVTFTLLWFVSRRSLKKVSAEIRSRIPPEGVQEELESPTKSGSSKRDPEAESASDSPETGAIS